MSKLKTYQVEYKMRPSGGTQWSHSKMNCYGYNRDQAVFSAGLIAAITENYQRNWEIELVGIFEGASFLGEEVSNGSSEGVDSKKVNYQDLISASADIQAITDLIRLLDGEIQSMKNFNNPGRIGIHKVINSLTKARGDISDQLTKLKSRRRRIENKLDNNEGTLE
jgi:hypothetical protein